MTNRIHHLNVKCRDPYELAGWWSQVIGYPRSDEDFPGDPEAMLIAPDGGGPGILFCHVDGDLVTPSRLHLDLQPADRTRDEEVERLLGIGATLVGDRRRPDGTGWVTLADPEGNEFCVERSAEERATT
ncbi:VOC family protein [Asanoa sp. WMMD1127]|uniref:VOC family protein n=1 Tax=Asanoa sp. WMMD1127 TaxID=3016107 RepID=UPI002417580E|nr:VOC family protein [Asanoa sp. WMMD1127]MDG4823798.1 VOC family protein [Asanoa sp. WMMD1127]